MIFPLLFPFFLFFVFFEAASIGYSARLTAALAAGPYRFVLEDLGASLSCRFLAASAFEGPTDVPLKSTFILGLFFRIFFFCFLCFFFVSLGQNS